MDDPDEATILTGLLDFYSDRATAHASFVVAGTFGIYAVLFAYDAFGQTVFSRWVFIIVYVALLLVNIYSFLNFGYYSGLSHLVMIKLLGEHYEEFRDEMRSELKAGSYWIYVFGECKKRILGSARIILFLFVFWLLAVLLPFISIVISACAGFAFVVIGIIIGASAFEIARRKRPTPEVETKIKTA